MTTVNESSRVTDLDGGVEMDDSVINDNKGEMIVIGKRAVPRLNWVWLNHQGENHDSRRLLEHRAKNCQCDLCFRELNKLPPDDPIREKYAARKQREEDREKRRVKKKAKKDVKAGKQACIRNFFRY